LSDCEISYDKDTKTLALYVAKLSSGSCDGYVRLLATKREAMAAGNLILEVAEKMEEP
jgi:hypothetical protein